MTSQELRARNAEIARLVVSTPPRSALDGKGRRLGPTWEAWLRLVSARLDTANARPDPETLTSGDLWPPGEQGCPLDPSSSTPARGPVPALAWPSCTCARQVGASGLVYGYIRDVACPRHGDKDENRARLIAALRRAPSIKQWISSLPQPKQTERVSFDSCSDVSSGVTLTISVPVTNGERLIKRIVPIKDLDFFNIFEILFGGRFFVYNSYSRQHGGAEPLSAHALSLLDINKVAYAGEQIQIRVQNVDSMPHRFFGVVEFETVGAMPAGADR